MVHLVQYFYFDTSDSKYGVDTRSFAKKNEYYLRCMYTFWRSVVDLNDSSCFKLYFVYNDIVGYEFIPGFSLQNFFNKIGLVTIPRESRYVLPQARWAGSMYLFDAVEAVYEYLCSRKEAKEDDYVLFFDNDVLFMDKIENLNFLKSDSDVLVYELGDISNDPFNFNSLDKNFLTDPTFKGFGGEFFGIKFSKMPDFIDKFKANYPTNGLKTEEHYISYLVSYDKLYPLTVRRVNDEVKRIWTTYSFSNVEPDDYKYKIIHLPAEKEYGLYYVSKKLLSGRKFSRDMVLRYCGLQKRPPVYASTVIARKAWKRLLRLVNKVKKIFELRR